MTSHHITNILVVGIGGQGVMTATEILAKAAISRGLDVKKTEVAGMAQRGGVVTSHVRFGLHVRSPQITPGHADLLLGFESAEALRWAHYLKRSGQVLVNTARLVPPVVHSGIHQYPEDPVGRMRAMGIHVTAFDAMAVALELGDMRLGNSVMLGALSDRLPFPAAVLKACLSERFVSRRPDWVKANEAAFDRGREVASVLAA
jgi:indolepyruvate ferredoxin oxidoreductase beta subunit